MAKGNIFERIGDIMSANVHAMLDKCENPEKMLDQNMRKAVEDLAELKDSAVALKADLTAAQRDYDAAMKEMQAEHTFAVNAMKAGDEATAAKFLQSEAEIKARKVDPAEKVLAHAKTNFETVQKAHNKLADDIKIMKNDMHHIKSTIRTAKATEKVANMKDPTNGYAESFTKYSEKAQRMLDEANARISMNEEPEDELSSLRQKYATGMQPDMSAALAGLRAECGITEEKADDDSARKAVQAMDDALSALRKEAGTE